MARATDSDVRAYVQMESGVDTTPFINAASVVATDLLASSGLSENVLTQIEIFLAAHFATLSVERGGLRRDVYGDNAQSYQVISEKYKGFNTTRFGQTAVALDTTGTLAAQGSANLKARFRVVGSASIDNAS